MADIIILSFFFLLHPGEYTNAFRADAMPFCICDLHLFLGNPHLDPSTCSSSDLTTTKFIGLKFTNQKNGIYDKVNSLSHLGSPIWCPILALVRHIQALHLAGAPPAMPLTMSTNHYAMSGAPLPTNTSPSLLSMQLPPALVCILVYTTLTFLCTPSAQAAPSFVPLSTPMGSAFSDSGAPMNCFIIFTSKPFLSPHLPMPCFAMEPSCLSL